jgi:flagellar basal body-associated protein FliL
MMPDGEPDPRPGRTAWIVLLLVGVMLTVVGMFYQLVRVMRWPTWPGELGAP